MPTSFKVGMLGQFLVPAGLQVMFNPAGVLLAHIFVTFPYMLGAVKPLLDELEVTYEEAAYTIGASAWQTFRHVILPVLRGGLFTGALLTFAHSLGEFGAVKVVSGNIAGDTQLATLLVQQRYQNFQQETAYSVSFILATAAVLCIIVVSLLRPKEQS